MIGDLTATVPQLVTAPEMLKLYRHMSFENYDLVKQIMEAIYKKERETGDTDTLFIRATMYCALFEAGRLQGIREERKRRK